MTTDLWGLCSVATSTNSAPAFLSVDGLPLKVRRVPCRELCGVVPDGGHGVRRATTAVGGLARLVFVVSGADQFGRLSRRLVLSLVVLGLAALVIPNSLQAGLDWDGPLGKPAIVGGVMSSAAEANTVSSLAVEQLEAGASSWRSSDMEEGPVRSHSGRLPPPSEAAVHLFRGLGLTRPATACADVAGLGVSWYYTWWYEPCAEAPAEFVPMLWGDWCPARGDRCEVLPDAIEASGATTLLGFNEPDWSQQSNMTVDRALDLWASLDRTTMRLGSPAVTVGPRGTAWLDEFMAGAKARGLRVDFIAAHWYGTCVSTAPLTAYLESLRRFNRPIWLTELGCEQQPAAVNEAFLKAAMEAVAEDRHVERVAWFTNRPYRGYEGGALVDERGELTAVGRAYAAFGPCLRRTLTAATFRVCPTGAPGEG